MAVENTMHFMIWSFSTKVWGSVWDQTQGCLDQKIDSLSTALMCLATYSFRLDCKSLPHPPHGKLFTTEYNCTHLHFIIPSFSLFVSVSSPRSAIFKIRQKHSEVKKVVFSNGTKNWQVARIFNTEKQVTIKRQKTIDTNKSIQNRESRI